MSENHWMMFGTFAEKRHFIYPRQDAYEGVIINANMAAHAPDGIAKFIQSNTTQRKYIIEPQTHAFQHNPKHIQTDVIITDVDEETGIETKKKTGQKKLKLSFAKLVEEYGDPVLSVAGRKPVTPRTFSDQQVTTDFVERCLCFQRNFISDRMANSEDSKYTSFDLNGSNEYTAPKPYALIPPYFFIQETTHIDWLSVNSKSINIALESKQSDEKIFAMIVLSQGMLTNSNALNAVIECYKRVAVDGYIIWIDDLSEHDAGSVDLEGLLNLAIQLNSSGDKEIINLHGSYFSVLATNPTWPVKSFTGVCHGPEFGEKRAVVPVGGGIPIARYYIPSLHQRIRYRETLELLRDMDYLNSPEIFHNNVCECKECQETINGDIENFTYFGDSTPKIRKTKNGFVRIDYPTSKTKLRCLRHYLERKYREYHFALTGTIGQILQDLENGKDEYAETIGLDAIEHLVLWKTVLQKKLSS